MNPAINLFTLNTVWSFRKEITFVLVTFFMILLLPFLAVITVTQAGIEEVSDQLVGINSETAQIQLYYPNGQPYKVFNATIFLPVAGTVTNEFGEPHPPYYLSHSGIDIAGRTGDPITVFSPGKVIYAGEIFWGFGKHVIVDHGDNVTSLYGHLSAINVKEGQDVQPGDLLGLEGSTGWSTGTHLHFEVRVFGVPVNPRLFIGSQL